MADDSGFTAISLVTDELNETSIPETEIHKNDNGRRYHQTAKNISSTILTTTSSSSSSSSTTSPAASMAVVTDATSSLLKKDATVQEEEEGEKEGRTEDVAFSQMVDDCFFSPQPPCNKLEDSLFTEMVDDCFFSGNKKKNPNQKLKKS